MQSDMTRPIVGIENRTAQEVFDIMCERFKIALSTAEPWPFEHQNYNCPCIHPSQCDESCVKKPAPSVAVKALEWQKVALGTLDWNWLEVETASTAFGAYSLQRHNTGHLRVMFGGKVVNFFEPEKHTDARAAAQADYEARIRSALSAQVQDVALTRLAIRAGGSGANVYAFTEADGDGDYVFYTEAKAALSVHDKAEWQPIETAPKDGTDVLLSSPHWHGDVVVGCWSLEGWRDRDDSDKLEPTHWMPRPAAPAAKMEEKP